MAISAMTFASAQDIVALGNEPAGNNSATVVLQVDDTEDSAPVNSRPSAYSERIVPEGIYPGMKYREYRPLYDSYDYVHTDGDRYSPAGSGVCSFLIPGLGQMICGEVGRGFAWFGGELLSTGVIAGGYLMFAVGVLGLISGEQRFTNLTYGGIGMMTAGSVAAISINIASIVDACLVAKIKNMYERDIQSMSALHLDMSPYISMTPLGSTSATPVAGLSLRLSF